MALAPIGLEPNMECGYCHAMLCVFDDADKFKESLEPNTGLRSDGRSG